MKTSLTSLPTANRARPRVALFASLLLLLPAVAAAQSAAAQPAEPSLAKQLTDNMMQILNEGQLDLIDTTFDPMVRMRSPAIPQPVTGIENFRVYVTTTRTAFPNLKVDIEEIITEGDTVVARFTLSGTHLGPFGPLPPTGRSFKLPGVAIVRIENGKILVWQDYWNAIDLYGALGFRLAPPAAAPPAAAAPPRPPGRP